MQNIGRPIDIDIIIFILFHCVATLCRYPRISRALVTVHCAVCPQEGNVTNQDSLHFFPFESASAVPQLCNYIDLPLECRSSKKYSFLHSKTAGSPPESSVSFPIKIRRKKLQCGETGQRARSRKTRLPKLALVLRNSLEVAVFVDSHADFY